MVNIRVVEVESELGAGTRGASLGIDAIKVASLNKNSSYFAEANTQKIMVDNSPLFTSTTIKSAKYLDKILDIEQSICQGIKSVFDQGEFPLVLSGDHANSAGTIFGIKAKYPEKRLGVVWIDAHADLHSPWTSPSGNVHGMPVAMALAEDNVECQINEPSEEAIDAWNKIKDIGISGPKIDPNDLVFIGIRDVEDAEMDYINRHGIRHFSIDEVRNNGPEKVAQSVLEKLSGCDLIYVSFDVDSMDTSISVGTGTPVDKGLSLEEATKINQTLVADAKVCSWEMVEVNPTLDLENKMAVAAFEVLEAVTDSLKNRN